jgi:MFS family permease
MVSSVGCPDPTAALKHWVYGTAVALVFPAALFPSNAPLVGTLLSFATFGVGFIARPVGGLFFGHIGDSPHRVHYFQRRAHRGEQLFAGGLFATAFACTTSSAHGQPLIRTLRFTAAHYSPG